MLNVILSLIIRYVDQFSRCLYVEYKSKGIDVQCQVTTILSMQLMYLASLLNRIVPIFSLCWLINFEFVDFTNAAYIPLVILYYIWTSALIARILQSIQVPLYVATKMASIRKSSFMVPSADTYARAAVRHIGYEPRCTPYWPHSVMWFVISILPESLIDNFRLGMCIKIRKKGLAKDAKKKSLWCFKYLLDTCCDSHYFFITFIGHVLLASL